MLNIISIEQKYAGHSTEVGAMAPQVRSGVGKYTIVVDDDIDPSDLNQVLWAVETRTDPARSIQVIERCHTSTRDPMVSMAEKRKYKVAPKPLMVSKCFIDACQPFEWRRKWYPVARSSAEQRAKVLTKYASVFRRGCSDPSGYSRSSD